MDLKLGGKNALVTGSHRGTGFIIAKHLAREGVEVLVHGLDAGQAEHAVAELGFGIAVTGDITTDRGAERLAEGVLRAASEGVDILVNNYGGADPGSWTDSASDVWLASYQKNVMSAQRVTRLLLPGMRARGWGRVINLGTIGSSRPNSRMPQYYAAKGALATMTLSLAKEVAGSGVRVNLVSPGLILTPEVEAAYLERGRAQGWGDTWSEVEAKVAEDIPIGRIVRREEVADLVTFLASPLADGVHGQNIRIDGGSLGVLS